MTFLPSIVAPVVDDHEWSTELTLPGPIEGSLIPVSSHCSDCLRARSRPPLPLWREWLARSPVAGTKGVATKRKGGTGGGQDRSIQFRFFDVWSVPLVPPVLLVRSVCHVRRCAFAMAGTLACRIPRIGLTPEAGGFARLDHGLAHRGHGKSRQKPGRVRQVRADAP